MAAGLPQIEQVREQERGSEEATDNFNLISKATSHPSCILFLKCESLNPGVGIIQGHEGQRMSIIGGHLRSCLPQMGWAVEASLKKEKFG